MAVCEEKRSLRLASCCRVEVRNGAAGRRVYGFSSTERTANGRPSSRSTSCRSRAVDLDEPRLERPGLERAEDVPVGGGDERHPGALALDDEPRRDRLHAPG